jgi:hypothetical protein
MAGLWRGTSGLWRGASGLWGGFPGLWRGLFGLGDTFQPAIIGGFNQAFNPSPFLVYSEDAHLAVRTNDIVRLALRGLTGRETGKWYAELMPIGARLRFAGVVDDTFSVRGAGGDAGTNRVGLEGADLVGYHTNDPLGHFAAPGTRVRIAYYADVDQVWIALGDGDWNGSPFASPVSGLGGLSGGGLVGAGYVGVTLRPVTGAGVRIRLPGDVGYELPDGYQEWSA